MQGEIKQIVYKPETYDKDGNLKKDAYFAINLNIDISEETREALMDVIAGGSPECIVELKPKQPTFAGVPSITEAEIEKGPVND